MIAGAGQGTHRGQRRGRGRELVDGPHLPREVIEADRPRRRSMGILAHREQRQVVVVGGTHGTHERDGPVRQVSSRPNAWR